MSYEKKKENKRNRNSKFLYIQMGRRGMKVKRKTLLMSQYVKEVGKLEIKRIERITKDSQFSLCFCYFLGGRDSSDYGFDSILS